MPKYLYDSTTKQVVTNDNIEAHLYTIQEMIGTALVKITKLYLDSEYYEVAESTKINEDGVIMYTVKITKSY